VRAEVALLASLLVALDAHAYWAPDHAELNRQVYRVGAPWGDAGYKRGGRSIVHVEDFLASQLYVASPHTSQLKGVGFDREFTVLDSIANDAPGDRPGEEMKLEEWVAQGGKWEDGFEDMLLATRWGGRRAVNHFHDPISVGLSGGGYCGFLPTAGTGLPYVDLARPGMSAARWAAGGAEIEEENKWGLPTVWNRLRLGMSELTPDKREAAFAAAFRAIGQLQHLIEDNTVPDHARDLPHPGAGFEDYLHNERSQLFGAFSQPWVVFQTRHVEADGFRAFWDRDVYGGANPIATLSDSDAPGVDEFTNANVLAYNRGIGDFNSTFEWSTVPDDIAQPFVRWDLLLTYPWPKLGAPSGGYYPSLNGTLPLDPIARDPSFTGRNSVDARAWAKYADPLMARAHGFAQSVLSLTLQPSRAEIVTAQDGALNKVKVRLWNLWPPGGPHSMTWHVDTVVVAPVIAHTLGELDPVPIMLDTPFDVAPGQVVESPSFATISWGKSQDLRFATHGAVLVTGHFGTSTKTPFQFAIPVPNAFVAIKQTGGQDLSQPFMITTGNCSTAGGACSYESEIGVYRNPLEQRVSGEISLLPIEIDILGRPADDALKSIHREDARISEVFMFALPRDSMQQDMKPVKVGASQLTLSGTNLALVESEPGHWVRRTDAPDAPDGPITFEADLKLADFYFPDLGDATVNAARASGTVYLAVFTTSGALYLQRLVLWALRSNQPASAGIGPLCDMSIPRGSQLNEDRMICSLSGGPVCDSRGQQVQTVFGHGTGAFLPSPTADLIDLGHLLFASDDVRPIRFMGSDVALSGEMKLPLACDLNAVSQVYPSGNGQAICATTAFPGLTFSAARNTTGSSTCPYTSTLANPHTATYRRLFFPGYAAFVQEAFGIQPPPEWEFDLQ
jgi:hypothetical protein